MIRVVLREDRIDEEAERLSKNTGIPKEEIKMVMSAYLAEKHNNKRQPPVPAPEGGISLRAAERKYKIPHTTLSGWIKRGWIPILLRTKNEVFLEEPILSRLAEAHHQNAGKGKKVITKLLTQ